MSGCAPGAIFRVGRLVSGTCANAGEVKAIAPAIATIISNAFIGEILVLAVFEEPKKHDLVPESRGLTLRHIALFSRLAKLKSARDRKRLETGKCEGRMSRARRAELAGDLEGAVKLGEAVQMAKRLRRANPKTGKHLSLRKISAELAGAGYLNERGKPFNPWSIQNMLSGPQRQIRKPTT
jgi:hypothetical protein